MASRVHNLPFEIDGIRYSVWRPAEVAEVIEVLARTFSRRDPPAVVAGLTEDDFEPYLALIAANAGQDGLTVVARDVASGALIGAVLADDAGAPPQIDLERLSPKFGPIYELFGELDAAIGDAEPIKPRTTLHISMLGVDERFSGLGIAQRLVEACLANAAALGYRTAVTEATNRTSQHIFGKLGFATRAEASYATFRREGVATFASIAEHGGIMSMIRSQ